MPIQLNEENAGKILVVHISAKLVKADYEHWAARRGEYSGTTDKDLSATTGVPHVTRPAA